MYVTRLKDLSSFPFCKIFDNISKTMGVKTVEHQLSCNSEVSSLNSYSQYLHYCFPIYRKHPYISMHRNCGLSFSFTTNYRGIRRMLVRIINKLQQDIPNQFIRWRKIKFVENVGCKQCWRATPVMCPNNCCQSLCSDSISTA